MVNYELTLLVKKLPRPQLVECLNKIGKVILNDQGILRKIEFLGFKNLYEKIPDPANPKDGTKKLHEANFFLLHFEAKPQASKYLNDEYLKLNRDVIRHKVLRKENLISKDYECDFFEDLKPPVYRKSIQKMIETGKQFKTERKFHNPFKPIN